MVNSLSFTLYVFKQYWLNSAFDVHFMYERSQRKPAHKEHICTYTHEHTLISCKHTYSHLPFCAHNMQTHTHTNTQLQYTEIGFTTSGEAPEQEPGVVYSDVQNV